ncbi:MAG: hypothetical protein IKN54_04425 [Lachnospiraceae bacterium]|nr:hypothetical protein [Lachnospiraceae bacterium]
MEESIYINDYISFDTTDGWFRLSDMAQRILYQGKEVICSYSGCVEWGHNFFCQLLDLYCGGSKYNFALGTVIHEDEIEEAYRNGHKAEIVNWVKKHKDDEWFAKAAGMLANIIQDVPKQ